MGGPGSRQEPSSLWYHWWELGQQLSDWDILNEKGPYLYANKCTLLPVLGQHNIQVLSVQAIQAEECISWPSTEIHRSMFRPKPKQTKLQVFSFCRIKSKSKPKEDIKHFTHTFLSIYSSSAYIWKLAWTEAFCIGWIPDLWLNIWASVEYLSFS